MSEGFIEKSTIQEDGYFMAYINAPNRRVKGVIEYIFWKYLKRMKNTKADEIFVAAHVIGGLESPLELNKDLTSIEELNQED